MTTTVTDFILYHASRLLNAEAKHLADPTERNKKIVEERYREFGKAVRKVSIKQGKLYEK
jgi:hypothetical protein